MSRRPTLRLALSLLAPLALVGMKCEPTGGMLPPQPPPEEPAAPPRPEVPEEPVGGEEPPNDDEPVPGPVVDDVVITGVSLYQVVEVPLGEDGATLAPVIAGKDALLRAFVEPLPGYEARVMHAVWTLEDGDGALVFSSDVRVSGASVPGDLETTLNLEIDGERVTPAARVSLALFERSPAPGEASSVDARFPEGGVWPEGGGSVSLGATVIGDGTTVRLVPLVYAADGSDRLPDTSAGWLDDLRGAVLASTPAPDATVWVDAPVELPFALAPSGAGWSDALVLLTDLRETRSVRDDEYLYGLVDPAATWGDYCGGSCVAGLSWRATDPDQAFARTSLGVGFVGPNALDTFVHELGHAHGRQHSPCGGPANPDPDYPHAGGLVGVQGWDAGAGELLDPGEHGDLMGYCRPRWTSDYTFAAFAERMAWLAASPSVVPPPGWPKRAYAVEVSLKAPPRLVGELTLRRPPSGDRRVVEVLDSYGDPLYRTEVATQTLEHTGAELLFVPVPDYRQAAWIAIDDARVALP